MKNRTPTRAENVELTLIQNDVNDLVRILLSTKRHSQAGILTFATFPLIGLVAKESFLYLSTKFPHSKLRAPNTHLFSKSGLLTKARSRIKLFDDNDGHAGLVDALSIAHSKSIDWYGQSHRGFLRSWIRRFQPDLGIFFADENLIATTHAILPSIGLSLDELKRLTPTDLNNLGPRLHACGFEVGAYLTRVSTLLDPFGKHVNLRPELLALDSLHLSHNDFIGTKAYSVAFNALGLTEQRFTGTIMMATAQINAALHVFPLLLGLQSNLLVRSQFLTAYHAHNALKMAAPHLVGAMPHFANDELNVLQSRELRNVCAHYGLRTMADSTIGADDPFEAVMQALSSITRSELLALLGKWLDAASAILAPGLSKSRFASARALLGDHS